jgi:hypothetical protein
MKIIRNLIFYSSLVLAFFLCGCSSSLSNKTEKINTENVMTKGMRITFVNDDYGKMTITAGQNYQRCYDWKDGKRCIQLKPKSERDTDGLGLDCFGNIKPVGWLTKVRIREGQQHFDNIDEAAAWLNSLSFIKGISKMYVWNNTGLVTGWRIYIPDTWFGTRMELQVDIWQIYIGGTELSKYQCKKTPRIRVLGDADLNAADKLAREINKKPVMTGGHKPSGLPGSQDDKITVEHLTDEQLKAFEKSVKPFFIF